MSDAGIIRNRLKVEGAVKNARAYLEHPRIARRTSTATSGNSLAATCFAGPCRSSLDEIPVSTPESDAMSKDLKKHGFTFVGTTICYAFMQSVGMVNDHIARLLPRGHRLALTRGRARSRRVGIGRSSFIAREDRRRIVM